MHYFTIFLQIFVALGLLNVWLVRPNMKSPYRGANSRSLKEEFASYGLPEWFYYLVGFLKIAGACALLLGLWLPVLVFPAALLIACLMLGALAMHIKIGDPWKKSVPALVMLLCSLFLCWASL